MPQDPAVPARAVLYARVSSKEQEKDGFSIPAQQKLLRHYAADNAIQVAREFTDVETAKRSGRTGFGGIIAFLRRYQSCRIILAEKTDRLYRNLKDWVIIDELNVEIHFVKENRVLSGDSRSSEKFVHGIKVLMAKNYIGQLVRGNPQGNAGKSGTGHLAILRPLGLRERGRDQGQTDHSSGPATRARNSEDLRIVRDRRRLLGRSDQEGPGGRHDLPQERESCAQATIHKILHNRIYTGDFDFDGKTYRGKYEPIISRELWQCVQEVIQQRLGRRRQKQKHDFAFSGLIACGHCGCSLVGELKKKRYVYYHCTGNKGKCPEPYVREGVLETQFTAALRRLKFDDELLAWVKQALRQSHADERREHEAAITPPTGRTHQAPAARRCHVRR